MWGSRLVLVLTFSSLISAQRLNELQNAYEHIEILDSKGKYVLTWVVNWTQKRISFNATVETLGYVGFGLSPKGQMLGADIVIGGVKSSGDTYFTDRHGVGNQEPVIDASQDWNLEAGWQNGTHTSLSFSRPLDTCDSNDYQINQYDRTTIMWAYGERDNGSDYHFQNYGTFVIYLLDPELTPRTIKESSFRPGPPSRNELAQENLELWTLSSDFDMPTATTWYHCQLFKAPRLNTKHHIVGVEIRLETEQVVRHVHHVMFYKCTPPQGSDANQFFGQYVGNGGDQCFFLSRPTGRIPTQYCTEVTNAWGIGGRMAFYPKDNGMAFGETPDTYYLVQTHYDNPDQLDGLKLHYEIDVFYSRNLRKNEVGIITVGHHIPGSPSILIPPNSLDHHVYGHCSADCTRTMFPAEGIKVFTYVQHNHYSVRNFKIRHFRGEEELPWITNDRNVDSRFQNYRVTHNDVVIRPGDHLVVECGNENTWYNGSVVGGFSTFQEMCLSYFYYYNKVADYSLCRSEIASPYYLRRYFGVSNITWDNNQLDYVGTSPPNLVGLTMAQLADRQNWTRELRSELQQDHRNLPQVNACSRSPFSSIGQGQVEGSATAAETTREVVHPVVSNEYVPPPRDCNVNVQKPTNTSKGVRWNGKGNSQRQRQRRF